MKNYIKGLLLLVVVAFSTSELKAQEVSTQDSVASVQSVSTTPRIEKVTDDFYINLDYYDQYPSYERLCDRQWHLRGWSKFCRIYGIICAAVGGFDLGVGIGNGDPFNITIGALCAAEGIAVAGIGDGLNKKCKETRAEITRINTTGIQTSEFSSGSVSFAPTINLISDNATHDKALGVGMRIEF